MTYGNDPHVTGVCILRYVRFSLPLVTEPKLMLLLWSSTMADMPLRNGKRADGQTPCHLLCSKDAPSLKTYLSSVSYVDTRTTHYSPRVATQ